jgi:uncharacterized membrane protein
MLIIALCGVVLTSVLAWGALSQDSLPYCAAGSGCDVVQASAWSRFLGVPLSLWGLATYVLLALLAVVPKQPRRRQMLAFVASVGFTLSIYLTAISFIEIKASCPYCLVSAALMTAAFVASFAGVGGAFGRHALGFASAVVIAAFMHVQAASVTAAIPAAGEPYLHALAKHLTERGAKFYGASWCPHCQQQKAVFGGAADALPFVECAPHGPGQPRATVCEMENIRNYPTWTLDERRFERVLDPKELAAISGFPRPAEQATKQ